ncbi:MAG: hypothetical protein ABIT76_00145 [Chthoniobacterales bacterium]
MAERMPIESNGHDEKISAKFARSNESGVLLGVPSFVSLDISTLSSRFKLHRAPLFLFRSDEWLGRKPNEPISHAKLSARLFSLTEGFHRNLAGAWDAIRVWLDG